MARQVTGVRTILDAGKKVCRMVDRFGVTRLAAATSEEFALAAAAFAAACKAIEIVDDFIVLVDRTPGGTGANDEDIISGPGTLANELEDDVL